MILIMSVSKVRAWGKPRMYCYWTDGRAVRGGNSEGVRSLHRQNHLLQSEHYGRMVRTIDLAAALERRSVRVKIEQCKTVKFTGLGENLRPFSESVNTFFRCFHLFIDGKIVFLFVIDEKVKTLRKKNDREHSAVIFVFSDLIRLFVSQTLDRVQFGRLAGGEDAEDEADEHGDDERGEDHPQFDFCRERWDQ